MAMRQLAALLLAFGLMVGVAGSVFAECGASHADTPKPTSSEKPQA
jgi:hypothetical protein